MQESLEQRDYTSRIMCPISLSDMSSKVNAHAYLSVKEFLRDVDLLVANTKEYYDVGTARGRYGARMIYTAHV